MDLELAEELAVVTGAGKGIGRAVTHVLLDEGARVVAGSRTAEGLEAIDGVTAVALDLATSDAPALLVQRQPPTRSIRRCWSSSATDLRLAGSFRGVVIDDERPPGL